MENLLAEEPRSGMPDDDGALVIATDHVGAGLGRRARARGVICARFWVVVVVVLVERRIDPCCLDLCLQIGQGPDGSVDWRRMWRRLLEDKSHTLSVASNELATSTGKGPCMTSRDETAWLCPERIMMGSSRASLK
jgi:hypothetical protein